MPPVTSNKNELLSTNQHEAALGERPPLSVQSGRATAGMPTLKTMKTASRTLKSGRKADVMPKRGRPAREADCERETGENGNVFCNLTPAVNSTSGETAFCRAGWPAWWGCDFQLHVRSPLFYLAPTTNKLLHLFRCRMAERQDKVLA